MSNQRPGLSDTEAEVIAPVPRITVQAFCETHDVAAAIQTAITDRRMQKAVSKVQMGGPAAAVEAFRDAPTPNALILENTQDRAQLYAHLEQLSQVCDAGTRVIVIGHVNDVQLYRDLTSKGVSDYLIAPIEVIDVVRSVSQLFASPSAGTLGRTVSTRWRESRASATTGSATTTVGREVGRLPSTACARWSGRSAWS